MHNKQYKVVLYEWWYLLISEQPVKSDDVVVCYVYCGTGMVRSQYQYPSFEAETEHADSASEQVAEFLSIDCQRLAQSVRCIPLHHRLHIDESVFNVSFS